MVLKQNRTNKLEDRWDGPGIVEDKHDNSYLIGMEIGGKRWIHANHLRAYHSLVASLGVVYEDDESFGDIFPIPQREKSFQLENKLKEVLATGKISEKQLLELEGVLLREEKLFQNNPGRAKIGKHRIVLKEGIEAKRMNPYRVPLSLKEQIDKQINELLQAGLIIESTSEFAHPVVCVSKKDGSIRLCVDYRHLNSGTIDDGYPMAILQEMILEVASANYITLLDMVRGYWQIPVEESCQHLTAFVTHRGQYQWRVMPFGLKGAAATFQRVMDEVLSPFRSFAMAYIDDIAIFSSTWEDHIKHLSVVLKTLKRNGFSLNLDKCHFAQPHIKYLGHIVGSGQHSPDPERVEAISRLERPINKKQLRSFLGICGYYRDYIPDFAGITTPLTDLAMRRRPNVVAWTQDSNDAFLNIKSKLRAVPLLFAPEIGKPYVLFTDPSEHSVGACLAQITDEGKEHPIAFASKKLRGAELRWATIEKEAFAVVWSLKKFTYWIYGNKVKIVTDHNPLKYLALNSMHSAKLLRWALSLQHFDVEVVHREGRQHINGDALS